ncbi:armadillo-type protein [Lophiotrema nucula]|uniref:Armadillo-type protein n=1 Tax=Lophiotrema nucula TaxID=690887 RepID=A0A6A5ZQI4_9PLEO|nr:armadillo-type protein [Lophiotrema nucula]
MTSAEDDDLKLLRASATSLSNLQDLIPKILWKGKFDAIKVHSRVREIDLGRVIAFIEPFQEDPQLLDTHLKSFIPPLVSAYLASLQSPANQRQRKGSLPLSHAICQILNLFCKVRGEKVIKGFLNNEPRYLEPILHELEDGKNFAREDDEPLPQSMIPWTERYILLLWMSHLMLAPFPLASMSTSRPSQEVSTTLGIELPPELPGITLRVLTICEKGLRSATKERSAAANLLVRLCIRPDMQELGLLDALIKWALSFFVNISNKDVDIHQYLGILTFLAGLVTSATNEEIGPFMPAIYQACRSIISDNSLELVKSSAVARKVVVKTFRNIVVHSIQAEKASKILDTTAVLEEVIEYLLEALADGDTPVRYSASKALSIITMKLESEMAGDVVEAILGSLSENVYWQGAKRNLSGVNPLRWHGLTLTLSHLLYRRAVSTTQFPDVLNALLLALAFEQRSATGASIGTNVRDAACFGIWALSRRYATSDLLAVDTTSVRASEHHKGISILQVLALELLVTACLDPAGNIRRGSSAALQELIGRNPNTVEEGIPLVQVVDFHAVGLRERAMRNVSIKAAGLHQMYWDVLFENLLGWRGTGSLDAPSRQFAASAIGHLAAYQSNRAIRDMADRICAALKALKAREVEERQGLVLAISALVNHVNGTNIEETAKDASLEFTIRDDELLFLWNLLNDSLHLEEKSFVSPTLRPEFTASSICQLLGALASMTVHCGSNRSIVPTGEIIRQLDLCLGRREASVMEAIPRTAIAVVELLGRTEPESKQVLISGWLVRLENEASYNGLRCSGFALALGAVYSVVGKAEEQNRIITVLTFRCTSAVAIEARTVALQAVEVLLRNSQELPSDVRDQVASALHIALNDYTITERGDVGSLVRSEAITTTGMAWSSGLLEGSKLDEEVHADVLRLSLEKLDKIRARASNILDLHRERHGRGVIDSAEGVSSYSYFSNALTALQPSASRATNEAVLLGFISSAGMGSESVVQNSRAALLDALDALPSSTNDDTTKISLQECMSCLVDLLRANVDVERILLPLLEIFGFLFDMQVMHRLTPTSFNFRVLLSLVQKSHFKSTHMQKLHLALDVYRGLGSIPATRNETITKVTSMLMHPFPKIRITAAETLWILTQEEGLKRQDWSLPSKSLKPVVDGIKSSLSATAA